MNAPERPVTAEADPDRLRDPHRGERVAPHQRYVADGADGQLPAAARYVRAELCADRAHHVRLPDHRLAAPAPGGHGHRPAADALLAAHRHGREPRAASSSCRSRRCYGLLLLAAALVGIGSSIFHPEASRVARLVSGGRHGLAQSIFQVGGNFGQAIGPLLAAVIVTPHGQHAIAWFALAALLGIALLWRVEPVVRAAPFGAEAPARAAAAAEHFAGAHRRRDRRVDRADLLEVFLSRLHHELLHVLPDRPLRGEPADRAGPAVRLPRRGGAGHRSRRADRRLFRSEVRDLGFDPGRAAVHAGAAARRPRPDGRAFGDHRFRPRLRLPGDHRVCAGTAARQDRHGLRAVLRPGLRHGRPRRGGLRRARRRHVHSLRLPGEFVPAGDRASDDLPAQHRGPQEKAAPSASGIRRTHPCSPDASATTAAGSR